MIVLINKEYLHPIHEAVDYETVGEVIDRRLLACAHPIPICMLHLHTSCEGFQGRV